jgi:uncharacterized protein (DUF302 family)
VEGDGLVTVRSRHSVAETIDRLAAAATVAGMRVFARIDHAAGAAEVGMELRPTEVILFGHPRGGTPLMQAAQTAGIDLPLKALAWQAEDGSVWLSVNDVRWLAARHGLGPLSQDAVAAVAAGMEHVAREASGG